MYNPIPLNETQKTTKNNLPEDKLGFLARWNFVADVVSYDV